MLRIFGPNPDFVDVKIEGSQTVVSTDANGNQVISTQRITMRTARPADGVAGALVDRALNQLLDTHNLALTGTVHDAMPTLLTDRRK